MYCTKKAYEKWQTLTKSQKKAIKSEMLSSDVIYYIDTDYPVTATVYIANKNIYIMKTVSVTKRGKKLDIYTIRSNKETVEELTTQ